MVAPDVQIEDGKGTILISSEEGETEGKEKVTFFFSFFFLDIYFDLLIFL